jgi:hypothetical protein
VGEARHLLPAPKTLFDSFKLVSVEAVFFSLATKDSTVMQRGWHTAANQPRLRCTALRWTATYRYARVRIPSSELSSPELVQGPPDTTWKVPAGGSSRRFMPLWALAAVPPPSSQACLVPLGATGTEEKKGRGARPETDYV